MSVDQCAGGIGAEAEAEIVGAGGAAADERLDETARGFAIVFVNAGAVDRAVDFQAAIAAVALGDSHFEDVALDRKSVV